MNSKSVVVIANDVEKSVDRSCRVIERMFEGFPPPVPPEG